MPEATLPTAVIGVGDAGGDILAALGQVDCVRIVGVADRDPAAAEQAGKRFGVPAYTDNRSLLAETRPQAIFLAVPPAVALDIVAACAARSIHVWKAPPLARSLDEGLAIVRRMEQAGLKLAVGTHRRFADGYRTASRLRGKVGQVFLATAHYTFNWGPHLGWRGDRASAGGGALIEVGYHPLDLLVWMLGLPEVVFGLSTCGYRPGQTGPEGQLLPVYDTDDTAALLLRYPGDCVATVVTSRRTGPMSEALSVHGRDGSIAATADMCLLRDVDGNLLDRTESSASPLTARRRQVTEFAKAVLSDAKTYECSARENLLNLALIEAAYLSSRTGQGESPRRLLATRELDEPACLIHRPSQQ